MPGVSQGSTLSPAAGASDAAGPSKRPAQQSAEATAPLSSRTSKGKASAGPAIRLRHLAVGALALASAARAADGRAQNSPAEGALGALATVGPTPGVPFVAKRSLKKPLDRFVADLMNQVGQKEADPGVVRSQIFQVRRTGKPAELSSKALEQAMKEYTPDVVNQAMTDGSICGLVELTLQECLRQAFERCPRLEASGKVGTSTLQEDCDRIEPLSGRLVHLANIARLAILKVTPELAHPFAVPFAGGPADVLAASDGAVTQVATFPLPKSGQRATTMILANERALAEESGITSDLQLVKAFVHEMFHALTNIQFILAVDEAFPRSRTRLSELATEFLATHYVTRDAQDSPYETRDFGNRYMLRVAEKLTGVAPLDAKAYEEGVSTIKRAFAEGDVTAVKRFVAAVQAVIKQYGPPATFMREPESAAAAQSGTASAAATSATPPAPVVSGPPTHATPESVTGTTEPPGKPESKTGAGPGFVPTALALGAGAIAAGLAGRAAVQARHRDPSPEQPNTRRSSVSSHSDDEMVTAPVSRPDSPVGSASDASSDRSVVTAPGSPQTPQRLPDPSVPQSRPTLRMRAVTPPRTDPHGTREALAGLVPLRRTTVPHIPQPAARASAPGRVALQPADAEPSFEDQLNRLTGGSSSGSGAA